MPLGYASAQSEKTVRQLLMLPSAGWKGLLETFEKHFLKELMPAVERNFNVSQAASQREIAGASMGGAQALSIGLKHPELFSKVGSFGAALMIFGTGFDSWFPAEIGSSNQNVQMYCGNEDFTRALHPPFQKWLDSKNVKYGSYSHSGGHEWRVWIQDLEQFLTSPKA